MVAFLDPARPHLESGLYFSPPHAECFRLEDAAYIKLLKGKGVAEMDFSWWDPAARAMHLLEVRDYSLPEDRLAVDFLVAECVQKATDCLLMLVAVWHQLPAGPRVADCIPDVWRNRPGKTESVLLTFVIKTTKQGDLVALGQLQNRVRDKLKGRLELLDLLESTTIRIWDHRTAEQQGVPVQAVEDFMDTPVEGARRGRRARR